MAGVKISALQSVGSALLTDVYPVVQGGVTKKESVTQLISVLNPNIQLASPSQVSGLATLLNDYLPLAGGTMSGALTLFGDPTLPLEAATKQYVDTVASGFTVILSTYAATTANLVTTYANGAAGVGATLTDNVGTFLPFAVDGVSPPLNSRILVKDQSTTFENGVYVLTTNGDSVSVPYVLTRATDYDQAPAEIYPGTLVSVNNGTANAGSSWLETATVTTIGVDPILFSAFSFGPSSYLLKANNLADVNSAATSRTNLGLGTVATKDATDAGLTLAVMVDGATVIGNLARFVDVTGSIEDSGIGSTTTGTGALVLANTPTLITPILGVATATSLEFSPSTSGIIGTTTNNNASSGIVGEYSSSVVLSGAAVGLTSGVAANVTTIALTEGDWNLWGEIWIGGTAGAVIQNIIGCITATSATVASTPSNNTSTVQSGTHSHTIGTQVVPILAVGECRISIAAPTTIYLVASVTFTTQPATAYGKLCARRMR